MGYSENDAMVRVDFFKSSGKWATTIALPWIGYNGYQFDEFKDSLRKYFKGEQRFIGMTAVCLEPYNVHSHPIMMKVDDIWI